MSKETKEQIKRGFKKGHPYFVLKEGRKRRGNLLRGKRGSETPGWKGGKCLSSDKKYYLIYCPEHPYTNSHGYVFEHRLVMEKILGRYLLSNEQVHHRNANGLDNCPENLEIITGPHYGIIECPFCRKQFLIR